MIAENMLNAIEEFHETGYVHRDIKPANFLIGKKSKIKNLYIVDYGLAIPYYSNFKRKIHKEFTNNNKLAGTTRYTSLNNHLGHSYSRRDDLESIANIFVYFLKQGKLP